jgi:hypothetical protein
MAKVRRYHIYSYLLISSLASADLIGSQLNRELQKLRSVAIGIEAYAAAHEGRSPTTLKELGERISIPELLGAIPGSAPQFAEEYGFFVPPLEVNLPVQGRVQIFLLRVQPRDGVRGAIWKRIGGVFDAGLLRENELTGAADPLKLQQLKPMGGVVPEPPRRAPEVREEITEYQKKVLALARAGKLPLDPPDIDPEDAPQKPATPAPEKMNEANGMAPMSSPSYLADDVTTRSEQQIRIWRWLAILVVVMVAVLLVRRRPK